MRRISMQRATAGMVVACSVYDNGGFLLTHSGEKLDQQRLNSLSIYGIGDLVIQDPRVADVTVQALVAPDGLLAPLYPTGATVKWNHGQIGIVSNANLGHIARPVVRTCFDGRLLRACLERVQNVRYPSFDRLRTNGSIPAPVRGELVELPSVMGFKTNSEKALRRQLVGEGAPGPAHCRSRSRSAVFGGVMADSEQVLSQGQVDALLGAKVVAQVESGAPAETPVTVAPIKLEELRAKEAAAPPPAEAAAPPTAGPPPAPASSNALQDTVDQLTQRVAYLESLIQIGAMGDGAKLQELIAKVDGILVSSQGTVGYGARQSFVCKSCQVQGNVAARLNCTSCGEENWWGWWPAQ